MKVHEYQGKEVLERYGVRTQRGILATTPAEAQAAFEQLASQGHELAVVKAQSMQVGVAKAAVSSLLRVPKKPAKLPQPCLG